MLRFQNSPRWARLMSTSGKTQSAYSYRFAAASQQGSTKFRLNLESATANCPGTLLVTRNYPKTQSAKLPRALLHTIKSQLPTEALTEHWLFRGGGGVSPVPPRLPGASLWDVPSPN
eukprot:FR736329.1.p1 GENE.FR736329.1~~FR736329.1.p1  ORF type:complete len:117 (+),score=3.49 FR736329.1:412-762(+)